MAPPILEQYSDLEWSSDPGLSFFPVHSSWYCHQVYQLYGPSAKQGLHYLGSLPPHQGHQAWPYWHYWDPYCDQEAPPPPYGPPEFTPSVYEDPHGTTMPLELTELMGPLVLTGASSSPDKALIPPAFSLPHDLGQYQDLL